MRRAAVAFRRHFLGGARYSSSSSSGVSNGESDERVVEIPQADPTRPLPMSSLLDRKSFDSLAKILYHEHYAPTAADPVKLRKSMYAARTELHWLAQWAQDSVAGDDETKVAAVKRAVLERVDLHKPLSYIVGWQPFLDTVILCEQPVLIPRPETEQWTLWLRKLIAKDTISTRIDILDMCCGSGCIGVALANSDPRVHVTSVDVSSNAVELSRRNFEKNNIEAARWSVHQGDMFKALGASPDRKFDILVSNPPYIYDDSFRALPDSVQRWEDRTSLVGDKRHRKDPLLYYVESCREAPKWLRPRTSGLPSLVVEVGLQSLAVGTLFDESSAMGWGEVELHSDLDGEPRWVAASLLS